MRAVARLMAALRIESPALYARLRSELPSPDRAFEARPGSAPTLSVKAVHWRLTGPEMYVPHSPENQWPTATPTTWKTSPASLALSDTQPVKLSHQRGT